MVTLRFYLVQHVAEGVNRVDDATWIRDGDRLLIGSYLMMLGFCFLIDDAENIWFVLGPILVLYVSRALGEERRLVKAFGQKWDAYAQSVPRFFPRRWPRNALETWDVNQWFKNGEYNAVVAVCLELLAIEIWHLS